MRTVPLHGKRAACRVALVDDEDYDLVIPYRWTVLEHDPAAPGRRSHGPYAISDMRRKTGETIWMHQLITGWTRVDHQDGDGLNNRRPNLRPASKAQNMANSRKNPGKTSRYKGVFWVKAKSKWAAKIQVNGRSRSLGRFTDEEDAAWAYDAAAREAFGEYAKTNFQDEPTQAMQARRQAERAAAMAEGRRKNSAFRKKWWKERQSATHTCAACGTEFQSSAVRVFYCSGACKKRKYDQQERERRQ